MVNQTLSRYIGFLLYIISQAFGSVIALSFISPMILAPLGSLSLIFNIIFSFTFTGTPITKYDIIGTILIVMGCTIVSIFGSNLPEPKQSIPKLIEQFSRPAFVAYSAVQSSIIILILFIIKYLEYYIVSLKDTISRTVSRRASAISVSENSSGIENNSYSSQPEGFSKSALHEINFSKSSENPSNGKVPFVESPTEDKTEIMKRAHSHGSLVRFSNDESAPFLQRTSTATYRSIKRGRLSRLVGILYACTGGMAASLTLLFTKSG